MIELQSAMDLIFEEAWRLDSGDLAGWLDLFTEDAVYWVPTGVDNPRSEPSIIYDDRARMEERVYRLTKTPAYAQYPPSETLHHLTNVRLVGSAGTQESIVRCNLVLQELRGSDGSQAGLGVPRWFGGRCEYHIRAMTDEFKIALKKVWLLERQLPQYNLTFMI